MSTSVSTEIIAERVLISDSTSMQDPEFGSSTYHTDLTVGDYIAFYASTDVVDGITITYSVETMNDDGTVTFYDDSGRGSSHAPWRSSSQVASQGTTL